MKIELEISDNEIRQEVLKRLTTEISNTIFLERWGVDKNAYRKLLNEAVKSAVKQNEEAVLSRAIKIAGEYMGKRGLKKMVDGILQDE